MEVIADEIALRGVLPGQFVREEVPSQQYQLRPLIGNVLKKGLVASPFTMEVGSKTGQHDRQLPARTFNGRALFSSEPIITA